MWDVKPPNNNASYHGKNLGRSRKLTIRSVLDVRDNSLPASALSSGSLNVFDRAIVVVTPQRAVKFTAINAERHNLWLMAMNVMAETTSREPPDLDSLLPADEHLPASAPRVTPLYSPSPLPPSPWPDHRSDMRSASLPPALKNRVSINSLHRQHSVADMHSPSKPFAEGYEGPSSRPASPRLINFVSSAPVPAPLSLPPVHHGIRSRNSQTGLHHSTSSVSSRRGFVFPGGTWTDTEVVFTKEQEDAMEQEDLTRVGSLHNESGAGFANVGVGGGRASIGSFKPSGATSRTSSFSRQRW